MSILALLVDKGLLAEKETASLALLEAALLVRRAGLEHLVTLEDVKENPDAIALAMAKAGELLAAEHAVLMAKAIKDPDSVSAVFDDGDSLRRSTLRLIAQGVNRGG